MGVKAGYLTDHRIFVVNLLEFKKLAKIVEELSKFGNFKSGKGDIMDTKHSCFVYRLL